MLVSEARMTMINRRVDELEKRVAMLEQVIKPPIKVPVVNRYAEEAEAYNHNTPKRSG